MSLNTAHANGGVLIFNGEIIVLYCDGVELHFDGQSTKGFGGSKKGRIYLTTHRMIFTNKSQSDPMQSFSFPFFSMSKIDLEQPVFGANYIKGKVTAQQGESNWTGDATFKLKFMTGGAIEYGQAMLQAAKMASRYMPQQPPPYMPQNGPYYPAQPPAYAPPAAGFNGFVAPYHVFPDSPPPNSVYMSNMPPPYPGMYPPPYANFMSSGIPQQPPGYAAAGYQNGAAPAGYPGSAAAPPPGFANGYPPQGQPASAPPPSNPKEQEAYGEALQSPYNPHSVFIPQAQAYPGQFDCAPPPYSEASKKDQ